MKRKTQAVLKRQEDDRTHDEGSVWELALVVIFFVIVFSTMARAESRDGLLQSGSHIFASLK